MSVATTDRLLEREHELEQVDRAVDAALRGGGRMLLIEGPPGVGKSRLLASARARARERGIDVLEARGAAIESEYAFGLARQLFEPAVMAVADGERGALFSGAAGLASALLGGGGGPVLPDGADTAFGAVHGLYWLTVNLADRGPVLLLVDDAHWADLPSLRFLGYLSRRLEGLPVVLLATGRPSDPEGGQAWRELAEDPVAEVLRPRPLSENAVSGLVRERLGAAAEEEFCVACHRATGGNPLFLRELVRALADAGVAPTHEGAGAVTEVGPPAVSRFVLRRLERLGPDAVALARAVAVLGGDAEPPLAARAAELSSDRARAAADLLVRADLFSADELWRFAHPIVRAAVYEDLLPGERSARHIALARLLKELGAPAERVAAQLLSAGTTGEQEWVAVLREASGGAAERGDAAGAVAHLHRALEESRDERVRAEVLCELGRWEVATREFGSAHSHLMPVLQSDAPSQVRTRAGVWLARAAISGGSSAPALAAFDAIVAELERAEGERSLELESEALNLVRIELSLRHLAPERLAHFERAAAGDPRFKPVARIHAASEQLVRGVPAADAAEAIEAVLASVPLGDPFALGIGIESLILAERYSSAARWVDLALQTARALGLGTQVAVRHAQRGLLALWRGAVGDAQVDAQTALDIAGTGHFYAPRMVALAMQAALERGELEDAQALADSDPDNLARERLFVDEFLTARGNLRIARGDVQGGLGDLLRCSELLAAYGTVRPTDWRSGAVRALSELGQEQRAREIAREGLAAARRFGAPRSLTRALRTAGCAVGGNEGLALLEEAVAVVKGSGARLEEAYAMADLGAQLIRRKRRREGREVLRLALERARECGASALSERVRGDLGAGGGRPPRLELTGVDALTPAERRVCDLAAGDLSNREVAQRLFVTEKTVELHLTNAYRKLGIRSRFQLASVIPAPQ